MPARLGAAQIMRVFQRYGFEPVATNYSLLDRLHGLGESFVLWGLTRAYNPGTAAPAFPAGPP